MASYCKALQQLAGRHTSDLMLEINNTMHSCPSSKLAGCHDTGFPSKSRIWTLSTLRKRAQQQLWNGNAMPCCCAQHAQVPCCHCMLERPVGGCYSGTKQNMWLVAVLPVQQGAREAVWKCAIERLDGVPAKWQNVSTSRQSPQPPPETRACGMGHTCPSRPASGVPRCANPGAGTRSAARPHDLCQHREAAPFIAL